MKIRTNGVDNFFYILLVICSLGTAWLTRIVITRAVRMAFKDDG